MMKRSVLISVLAALVFGASAVLAVTKLRITNEKDGSEMVLVPGGYFIMGDDEGNEDAKPAREVYLDSFYIDKYYT